MQFGHGNLVVFQQFCGWGFHFSRVDFQSQICKQTKGFNGMSTCDFVSSKDVPCAVTSRGRASVGTVGKQTVVCLWLTPPYWTQVVLGEATNFFKGLNGLGPWFLWNCVKWAKFEWDVCMAVQLFSEVSCCTRFAFPCPKPPLWHYLHVELSVLL